VQQRGSERAALAIAAVVLVLSSVVLAVGGPSKTKSESALASATPVPSASAQPEQASAPPVVTQAPATAAPTSAPAPVVAVSGAVNPAAAKPPVPGNYEYAETDSSGSRNSSLVITDHGSGRQTEDLDSGGAVDEMQWSPSGKYDLATFFSGPTGSVHCDWTPDFLQYKFPLHTGLSWNVQTSCHPSASSSIALSGSSHVSGARRMTAAGSQVDVWVVLTDATITFKGNGATFTEKLHDEDDFLPDHGITVREVEATTDTGSSGQQSKDTTTRDLKSLEPGTSA